MTHETGEPQLFSSVSIFSETNGGPTAALKEYAPQSSFADLEAPVEA